MNVKFKYGGFDGRVWWISAVCVLLTGGALAALWMTAGGAYYLAAWVSMACAVIVALCLLSVPRRIIVGDHELELRCLVETTYIPLSSIADVEVLEGWWESTAFGVTMVAILTSKREDCIGFMPPDEQSAWPYTPPNDAMWLAATPPRCCEV